MFWNLNSAKLGGSGIGKAGLKLEDWDAGFSRRVGRPKPDPAMDWESDSSTDDMTKGADFSVWSC
jgi:hypothetical protein